VVIGLYGRFVILPKSNLVMLNSFQELPPCSFMGIRLTAQHVKMSKSGHKCKVLNFLSSISEEDIC
jgi:hypothetical protein